jgi:hypothetical protein
MFYTFSPKFGPSFINLICLTVPAMTHVALDWISGNWYFLDDGREAIYFCTHYMEHCMIAIDLNLSKPRGIALDPTSG